MISLKKDKNIYKILSIIVLIYFLNLFIIRTLPYSKHLSRKATDFILSVHNKILSIKPSSSIVIIAIDDETLKNMNLTWPWKRALYIPLINKLSSFNPKVIYLNFFLLGESAEDKSSDIFLANTIKEAGNIILPYAISEKNDITYPYELFRNSASSIGFSSKEIDSDGVIRRSIPFKIINNTLYPSVEISILSLFSGNPIEELLFNTDTKLAIKKKMFYKKEACKFPISKQGDLLINYLPPERFQVAPLSVVINNKVSEDIIKGCIALVGSTSSLTGDIVQTPYGYLPSIYVIANTLDMYLSKRFILPIPEILYYIITFFISCLFGLIIFKFHPVKGGIITFSSILLLWGLNFLAFHYGMVVDISNLTLLLILLYISVSFYRYIVLLEEKVFELNQSNEEIKKAQKELIRQEQLATIGRLTSQILHEFSHPINNLKSCLELLRKRIMPSTPFAELLEGAYEEVKKMATISRQLKSSYTPHIEHMNPCYINTLIEETIESFKYRFEEENINLIKTFSPSLPPLILSPEKIKQVITNIISNAIDALKGKEDKRIEIVTGEITEDDGKHYQYISISDNGCGIPQEEMSKLFTAFYTTKSGGEGSGLGLFICYEIIRAHKGTIEVKSAVGKGTTFMIKLPS